MKKQKMDICRKTGYFKGNKFLLVQLTNSSYSMLYVCAGIYLIMKWIFNINNSAGIIKNSYFQ